MLINSKQYWIHLYFNQNELNRQIIQKLNDDMETFVHSQ
jgi:hypothetical protein